VCSNLLELRGKSFETHYELILPSPIDRSI